MSSPVWRDRRYERDYAMHLRQTWVACRGDWRVRFDPAWPWTRKTWFATTKKARRELLARRSPTMIVTE